MWAISNLLVNDENQDRFAQIGGFALLLPYLADKVHDPPPIFPGHNYLKNIAKYPMCELTCRRTTKYRSARRLRS